MPNINMFSIHLHILAFHSILYSFPPPPIQQDLVTLKASQRYGIFLYCFERHLNSDVHFSEIQCVCCPQTHFFFHIHQSSPGNLSMNNQPGTPRDDGEMSGNFLNPFQSESVCMQKDFFLSIGLFVKYSSHLKHLIFFLQYSPNMTMSV